MKPYNVYKNARPPEEPEKRPDDAFERACEASRLGDHGDATAYAQLETMVLTDDGSWTEEGALADRIEVVSNHASAALDALARRVEPRPEDLARWRERLTDTGETSGWYLSLFGALGERVRPMLEEARVGENPIARMRAIVLLGKEAGFRAAIEHEDEEIRFAALANADQGICNLHYDAIRRYPREPSARVRKQIALIWMKTVDRVGLGLVRSDLAAFLRDEDPAIVDMIERHVKASRP